ncbi:bifunctional TH2 protein, mitochondrial-like [Papaver somniferum]|uniref:bifunctional TH2 protein, mitochondrial-like n=1 Tax=Papaver somniferum TaxID=3469 RepID=UPI000E700562|nr:bifunctional TH2 protein, mitochondrial-like [Papaver somniferum]
MALVQESSSKEVVEINSMSTSKEDEEEEMSESDSDEISMSGLLWTSCRNEALYLIYSPLFVHIASGSLDDKEFDQYVADYAYLLKDFVEVYKLAAVQCKNVSHKTEFLRWSSNVKQELGRDNSLVGQKLVLNPTKETTLHPATAKYKEFLLATASGNIQVSEIPIQQSKIPAYTLGAGMPSLRLYAFLSEAMQNLVSPYVYSHPYSKWLKEYSYESFERSYLDSEKVLDELCDSLTEKEVEVVERLYYQAMALQMDFFYSRQSEQTLIIPIYRKLDPKEERLMLFADFDFTCTSVASLEILANIEILTAQKPDQQLQGEDRERDSHIT